MAIASFVPLLDLKSLRLSCKALRSFVDPELFREITLYPHMGSFVKTFPLTMSDRLKGHVQRIVYDSRWYPFPMLVGNRVASLYGARVSLEAKTAMMRLATDFQERTFHAEIDSEVEIALLARVMGQFSSLDSIYIRENSPLRDVNIATLPQLYDQFRQQACQSLPGIDLEQGEYKLRGLAKASRSVLIAAFACFPQTIRKLEIDDADWSLLFGGLSINKHLQIIYYIIIQQLTEPF